MSPFAQARAHLQHPLQPHFGHKAQEGRQQQEAEVSGEQPRERHGGISGLHFCFFVPNYSHRTESSSAPHQPHRALCGSACHGAHCELLHMERGP